MARIFTTQRIARATMLALAVGGLAVSGASARACTKTWSAEANGTWSSASSWTPAGVPGPSDDVCLSGPASYTVTVAPMTGGAQMRTLTVGGVAGAQTLDIVGGSVAGDPDQQGTMVIASGGGTIAGNGEVILDATDGTPGALVGGAATLAGGPFTNVGTILALSHSANGLRDYLRVPLVNAPTGLVQVSGGFLDYGGGTTFENHGRMLVDEKSNLLLESEAQASDETRFVNAGSIATSGGLSGEGVLWTQAGGSVSDPAVYLANSGLDYQSGTGSFVLTEPLAESPSSLSGTIPVGQTVTLAGGTFGWPNSLGWTVSLGGAQVVNRGTLVLQPTADLNASKGGPVIVEGAPLVNDGVITASGTSTYASYLRSDVMNGPDGRIDVLGPLTQDGANAVVNHGLLDLHTDSFSLFSGSLTNARDGSISLELAPRRALPLLVGTDATLQAGGALLPVLDAGYRPAQGQELRLISFIHSPLLGAFAKVGGGFSADYGHAGYVAIRYGMRVAGVSGGRGRLSVALVCPPGGPTCPPVSVRATAVMRHRTVVVATGRASLAAGRTTTLELRLNRLGRTLLARSSARLAVRVVVESGARTLAQASVRVSRL